MDPFRKTIKSTITNAKKSIRQPYSEKIISVKRIQIQQLERYFENCLVQSKTSETDKLSIVEESP